MIEITQKQMDQIILEMRIAFSAANLRNNITTEKQMISEFLVSLKDDSPISIGKSTHHICKDIYTNEDVIVTAIYNKDSGVSLDLLKDGEANHFFKIVKASTKEFPMLYSQLLQNKEPQ